MKNYILIFFIALVGVSIYIPSLSNSFVWDDHTIIEQNPSIRAPSILYVFTHPFLTPGFAQENSIYYRPITTFAFWLVYRVFGDSPLFFRLLSFLFHFIAIILVYALARKFLNFENAIVAMAFFALNPVHTESVCFPSAISDIIVAVFLLASVIVYISKKRWATFVAPILWLFAVLAKENAAMGIIAIVLYDILFRQGIKLKNKLFNWGMWLVALIIYFVLRINALGGFGFGEISMPLGKRIFFAPYLLSRYFLNLFFPLDIKVLHSESPNTFTFTMLAVGIVGIIIIALLIVYLIRKKDKVAQLGVYWVIIFIIPVLGIVGISTTLWSDRFLYVPSVGGAILIGFIWQKYGKDSIKNISYILLIAYFLFFFISSVSYAFYWRDDNTLYRQMIKDAPTQPKGYSGMSGIFINKNLPDSAYYYAHRAIDVEPNYLPAMILLAQLQMQKNNLDSAKYYLDKAIDMYPDYVYCYENLGLYWISKGDTTLATKYFIRAHQIAPHDYIVNKNLGVALISLGDTTSGIELLKRACIYYPEGVEAQFELLDFYYSLGDTTKVKELLDKYPQLWQFIRK